MYWQVMGVSERIESSIITGFVASFCVGCAVGSVGYLSSLPESIWRQEVCNASEYDFLPIFTRTASHASTRCAESKLKKFQIYLTCVNPGKSEFFHKGGARSFSGFVRISQITTHLNDNALVEANHGVDGGACLWWKNGFGEEFQ
jgi:hypothetical protein